jgi:hypothetical protein
MTKPVFAKRFWEELAAACPCGPCKPEWVESWFEIQWPKLHARGYKNHRAAVTNWWSRVRPGELEQARERIRALSDHAESEEREQLAREVNADPAEISVATRPWKISS